MPRCSLLATPLAMLAAPWADCAWLRAASGGPRKREGFALHSAPRCADRVGTEGVPIANPDAFGAGLTEG